MKKIIGFICLLVLFSYGEVTHSGLTGTNIHTVYRWQFADSAARANQSVSAADTMKLAYQRSDSTSWVLVSTSGIKWKKISYASNQNTLTTSNVTFNKTTTTRDSTSDLIATDTVKGGTIIGGIGTFTGNTYFGYNSVDDSTKTEVANSILFKRKWLYGGIINCGIIKTSMGANGYSDGSNLDFYTVFGQNNGTSPILLRMRIADNGYVGINTVNPAYQLDVNGAGNFSGALSSTTLNTGHGDNEIYPMNQATTTSSDVVFNKTTTDTVKGNAIVGGTVSGTTGAFSGALTGTTLNTGNGANELYAMDQNVRTSDSINALTFRSTRVNSDSITTNGTDFIKYSTGTFPCTLSTSYVTVQDVKTARYSVIGNFVTIKIPELSGISNSQSLRISCGSMPDICKPSTYVSGPIAEVYDQGLYTPASFEITTTATQIIIRNNNGTAGGEWTTTGTKGIYIGPSSYTHISYIK